MSLSLGLSCLDEDGSPVDWWFINKRTRSLGLLYSDSRDPSLRACPYSLDTLHGLRVMSTG